MKNKLFLIRSIEMLLCIIILFVGFNGLDTEDFYLGSLTSKLYPLLGVLVFALVLMEFSYSKPIIRLIYIVLVINFLVFIVRELNMANMCIWFFTLLYLIPFLIVYVRTKNAKTEMKMIREDGKLDVGVFNKKQATTLKRSFVLTAIILLLLLI